MQSLHDLNSIEHQGLAVLVCLVVFDVDRAGNRIMASRKTPVRSNDTPFNLVALLAYARTTLHEIRYGINVTLSSVHEHAALILRPSSLTPFA